MSQIFKKAIYVCLNKYRMIIIIYIIEAFHVTLYKLIYFLDDEFNVHDT